MHNFGHQPLYIHTTPTTGKTEASVQEQQYTGGENGRPNKQRPDTSKTIISALLYADDVALIASPNDMQLLLSTAEQHSRDYGYRWHPSKCAIINPKSTISTPPTTYHLYNQPVPTISCFQYFGLPFTST
ncbi:hypothetical protein INT45_014181, partial [Circinella minor]